MTTGELAGQAERSLDRAFDDSNLWTGEARQISALVGIGYAVLALVEELRTRPVSYGGQP